MRLTERASIGKAMMRISLPQWGHSGTLHKMRARNMVQAEYVRRPVSPWLVLGQNRKTALTDRRNPFSSFSRIARGDGLDRAELASEQSARES